MVKYAGNVTVKTKGEVLPKEMQEENSIIKQGDPMNDVEELESIPTKIKYKGIIWIPLKEAKINKPGKGGGGKKNYFLKWFNKKHPGNTFTLEDFFKEYPKHQYDKKCRVRIDKIISELIQDKKIMQINKDQFKVLKSN